MCLLLIVPKAYKYDWFAIDGQDGDLRHSVEEIRAFHAAEFKQKKPNMLADEREQKVDELVTYIFDKYDLDHDGYVTKDEFGIDNSEKVGGEH